MGLLEDVQPVGEDGRVELGPQDVLALAAAQGGLAGPQHRAAAVRARRAPAAEVEGHDGRGQRRPAQRVRARALAPARALGGAARALAYALALGPPHKGALVLAAVGGAAALLLAGAEHPGHNDALRAAGGGRGRGGVRAGRSAQGLRARGAAQGQAALTQLREEVVSGGGHAGQAVHVGEDVHIHVHGGINGARERIRGLARLARLL